MTNANARETVTIETLAKDKGLPVEFLAGLGMTNDNGSVLIPYYDFDGKLLVERIRSALKAKDGSRWPTGAKLIPYGRERLASAREAGNLVIPEGESDCWTLWPHNFHALGIPGATATKCLTSRDVEGIRRIFAIREPDDAGVKFIDGLCQRLRELNWNGEFFVVALEGAKDPNDLYKKDSKGFTVNFQAALDRASKLQNADVPILETAIDTMGRVSQFIVRPWPVPPAPEAFHGLAGEFVNLVDPTTEADRVAILIQFLVFFGSSVGRGPHFLVEDDRHGAQLFAVLAGDTAKARKGTSLGRVRAVIKIADPEWEKSRIVSGLSTGEGLIWAVHDPIEGIDKNGQCKIIDEGIKDKRLLVVQSELAGALRAIQREGNTLSPILRDAWDRGDLRTLTKNSPANATGAHICIVAHITIDEALRYIDKTEIANGLLNRFLWFCATRSKLRPRGGRVDPAILHEIGRRVTLILEDARRLGLIDFDQEAGELWDSEYARLSAGRSGLLGHLLNRAEPQVIRLALSYALLDRSPVIRVAHLRAAFALWKYSEDSAIYIFGDSLGDPTADEILRSLRAAAPDGLTRTELIRMRGGHKSSADIGRALGVLLRERLARFERNETGGRPEEVWYAVAK